MNEIAWLLVAFVILIALIIKPIKRSLFPALDKRIADIRFTIEEAQRSKADAKMLLEKIRQEYVEAQKNALIIVKNAESEAASMINDAEEKIAILIDKYTEVSKQRIAQERYKMLSSIQNRILDSALEIVRESLKSNLSVKQDQDFIDQNKNAFSKLVQ